jgi:hypothetical protein
MSRVEFGNSKNVRPSSSENKSKTLVWMYQITRRHYAQHINIGRDESPYVSRDASRKFSPPPTPGST